MTEPKERRKRTADCTWRVEVSQPVKLSERAVGEFRSVAEITGNLKEASLFLSYTAVATARSGLQFYSWGMTKGDAISNAVRQIKVFTGYSENDLKIEIVYD